MVAALVFLAVLSVLVLIHELGHYVAARLCGVKAEEFGYGFPPRAFGYTKVDGKWIKVKGRDRKKYPDTVWSVNCLPLGGFVRLKGESGENAEDEDSFLKKNGWQKFFILAAGVLMNWILAAVIFSGGFMIGVPADLDSAPASAITSDERIEATLVLDGSAAGAAGIQSGDVILAINGMEAKTVPEAKELLKTSNEGDERTFLILRENERLEIRAESAYIADLDAPGFGIILTRVGKVRFPIHTAVVQGVSVTATFTYRIVEGFVLLVRDLIVRRPVDAEISGPVGIAVITGKVADQGIWALLQFTAILSLNLAVINFLPIPALDGGRAVFVMIEGLRRRRNNPRFEAAIHQIGFMLLLLLIFIVTINDIRRYGTSIWNGLLSVVGLR